MAQLMPLPLTVSCFSKIQIGFTFLVPAHLDSPGKTAVKRVCVCVCMSGDAILMLSSLLLLDVSSSCTNADEHFLKSCRKNRVKVNTGLNFYRIVMDAFNWSCQF